VRNRIRIAVQSTIADDRTPGVIEVEYRREAEVDSVRGKFFGDA
jgi:hypothetical protein